MVELWFGQNKSHVNAKSDFARDKLVIPPLTLHDSKVEWVLVLKLLVDNLSCEVAHPLNLSEMRPHACTIPEPAEEEWPRGGIPPCVLQGGHPSSAGVCLPSLGTQGVLIKAQCDSEVIRPMLEYACPVWHRGLI